MVLFPHILINSIIGGKPKVTGLRVFKTATGYLIIHQPVLLCEVGAINVDIEAIKTVKVIYCSDPDKAFAIVGNKGIGPRLQYTTSPVIAKFLFKKIIYYKYCFEILFSG
jgi:hypothetical protein